LPKPHAVTGYEQRLRGFSATGTKLSEGRLFDATGVREIAQEVVIDTNAKAALFADETESVVDRVIVAGKVPLRIVGVVQTRQGGFGSSQNPALYIPYTTAQTRFLGSNSLRSVTVRVRDDVATSLAEQAVTQFLTQRHGTKDFFILNTDDIRSRAPLRR